MIIAVSANKALSIKRRGCGSKVFKVLLGDYNFVVSFFFKSSRDGHRAARCSADMRADDKTESHDRICGGCFSVCKIKQCRMKHGPVSPPRKKTPASLNQTSTLKSPGAEYLASAGKLWHDELDRHPSRLKLCLHIKTQKLKSLHTKKHKRNMHD